MRVAPLVVGIPRQDRAKAVFAFLSCLGPASPRSCFIISKVRSAPEASNKDPIPKDPPDTLTGVFPSGSKSPWAQARPAGPSL